MNRRTLAIAAPVLAALLGAAWYYLGVRSHPQRPPAAPRPRVRAAVAVVAARPVKKAFAHEVEALGTVRANESVDIAAKVADRVAAIRFSEGQQVRKGDVLIELDSDEARADLAAAQAEERDSRSQYKRSQELYQTRALVGSAARAVAGDDAGE